MEHLDEQTAEWLDFDMEEAKRNRQLVADILQNKAKNFREGVSAPYLGNLISLLAPQPQPTPTRNQSLPPANSKKERRKERKRSESPPCSAAEEQPVREEKSQKDKGPSQQANKSISDAPAQSPAEQPKRTEPLPLRVSKPSIGLWMNRVHLQLKLARVDEVKADTIVVAYNRKQGLRIYPCAFLAAKEQTYSVKESLARNSYFKLGRLGAKKRVATERQWEVALLRSSNPNYGNYMFVEIETVSDIYVRLSEALDAVFHERLQSAAISYLNYQNEPSDQASHEIMHCIMEVLMRRGFSRHPFYLTLLAETKEKYRSLARIFQVIIDMDIHNDDIVAA